MTDDPDSTGKQVDSVGTNVNKREWNESAFLWSQDKECPGTDTNSKELRTNSTSLFCQFDWMPRVLGCLGCSFFSLPPIRGPDQWNPGKYLSSKLKPTATPSKYRSMPLFDCFGRCQVITAGHFLKQPIFPQDISSIPIARIKSIISLLFWVYPLLLAIYCRQSWLLYPNAFLKIVSSSKFLEIIFSSKNNITVENLHVHTN